MTYYYKYLENNFIPHSITSIFDASIIDYLTRLLSDTYRNRFLLYYRRHPFITVWLVLLHISRMYARTYVQLKPFLLVADPLKFTRRSRSNSTVSTHRSISPRHLFAFVLCVYHIYTR